MISCRTVKITKDNNISGHKSSVNILSVCVGVESLLDILTCHSRQSTSGTNNNYLLFIL